MRTRKMGGQNVKAVAFKLHEPLHNLDGASCRGGLSLVALSDVGDGWSKSPLASRGCAKAAQANPWRKCSSS